MWLSLAARTKQTYASAWKSYNTFCITFSLHTIPITEYKLIHYVTHMATTKIAHQSIQVYISGLAFHGQMYGAPFKISDMSNLYHVMRGIKRSQGNSCTKAKRIPITIRHMQQIHKYLIMVYPNVDGKMVWSAVTLAFFGLLRSSEYTSPTAHTFTESTLRFSDITLTSNRLFIHVRVSKTDTFRQGTVVRLFSLNSILCPVAATSTCIQTIGVRQGPIYTFQNGSFLTRTWMAGFLQTVFPFIQNINTHSFRIGGATAASTQGIPDNIIQTMGRWSSDCYRQYIRVSDQELCDYQRRMVMETNDITIFNSHTLSSI